MSATDRLTIARTRLAAYLASEAKILSAQSYSVGERRSQRTQLEFVQKEIRKLQIEIGRFENNGSGAPTNVRVMPRDM